MRKVLLICLAICFVFAMYAMAADDMGKSSTVKGWVSDDKCGAKGANAEHADCTKKCVGAGEKLVVVSDKDHSIINVDNQDALKGHEGHHVRVTGTMDNGNLHVTKVDMLKQPKAGEQKGEHKSGM